MRTRLTVIAKCLVCLAVAAAGDPSFLALGAYWLLRVLGTYWAGEGAAPTAPQPGMRLPSIHRKEPALSCPADRLPQLGVPKP